MTIVFSAARPDVIIMMTDSAITEESTSGQYRDTSQRGAKGFPNYGVGCVTTWGERRGNGIKNKLLMSGLRSGKSSFSDLDDLIHNYLKEEYQPHLFEANLADIGYHVGGFDIQGQARLYHRYWGIPRPNVNSETQDYRFSDHSPSPAKPLQLVYNGRSDIAETIINLLIREIETGREPNFDILTIEGIIELGDFILRMAAELTPEVGPPFYTFIINSSNQIQTIHNYSFLPLDKEKIRLAVQVLKSQTITRSLEQQQITFNETHLDNQTDVRIVETSSAKQPLQSAGGTVTVYPSSPYITPPSSSDT